MINAIDIVSVYKKVKNNKREYYILDNINLNIKKGKMTLIVGESGSGKTTLLNIITNLDKDYIGEVFYNGFLSTKTKCNFGVVFQSLNLFPNLNVYQNIKIGNRKKSKKEVFEIMDYLDLKKYQKSFIYELSGGEMQKVAIARCLLKSKEIIVLDEPTKSLDNKTSIEIMELLNNIKNKYKTTIILTTHNNKLVKYGDKIIKIEEGKVIEKVNVK